jgi:hypothetical protein
VGVARRIAVKEFELKDDLTEEGQTPLPVMNSRRITFSKLVEWLHEQGELGFKSVVDVVFYGLPGQARGDNKGKSSTRVINSDVSLRGAVKIFRDVGGPVLNMFIMRGEKENLAEAEELHFDDWKKEVGEMAQEQAFSSSFFLRFGFRLGKWIVSKN